MAAITAGQTGFYFTGGTVPAQAPSYVVRHADQVLYESLLAGRFCYVLTSRQIGKSSLRNSVANRLRVGGVTVAELDLTGIGQNLTIDQWYDGLVYELGRELNLKSRLRACWDEYAHLGPLNRFTTVLREGALGAIAGRLVIFIDEIEVVRSLKFSTDEFFAAIRECYNKRTSDPALNRLTFCLLGMATPADLIQDKRITPFNIGERIDLADFTRQESAPLAVGFAKQPAVARELLNRVLYWTNGHPYLTQCLCKAIAEDPNATQASTVDLYCERLFLSNRAREVDANLAPIQDYLLHPSRDAAKLLTQYGRVVAGKKVLDDPANEEIELLKLSGVVRAKDGQIVLRNRIYAKVFDQRWVRDHMPDSEVRRQRAAYRRGLFRAIAVSACILAVMGVLLWQALKETTIAQESERQTSLLLYAADMNLADQALARNDVNGALQLLNSHKDDPERSWDWAYLWQSIHWNFPKEASSLSGLVTGLAFSPDGRYLLAGCDSGRRAVVWDFENHRVLNLPTGNREVTSVAYSPSGFLAAIGTADGDVYVCSAKTGNLFKEFQAEKSQVWSVAFSPDSTKLATAGLGGVQIRDLTGRTVRNLDYGQAVCKSIAFFSDNRRLVVGSWDHTVRIWDWKNGKDLIVMPQYGAVEAVAVSPDGFYIAAAGDGFTPGIWYAANGFESTALLDSGPVDALAFSAVGNKLATSTGYQLSIWDVPHGSVLYTMSQGIKFHSLSFSPNGSYLATGSDEGELDLWGKLQNTDTIGLQGSAPYTESRTPFITSAAFSPDCRQLAVIDGANILMLWDGNTGRLLHKRDFGRCRLISIAYSADSSRIFIGRLGDTPLVCQAATGEPIAWNEDQLLKDQLPLAVSRDGRWFISAQGGDVTVWDLRRGQLAWTLSSNNYQVQAACFDPSGSVLAVTDLNGSVRLWDINTHKVIGTAVEDEGEEGGGINAFTYSPDGKTLLAGEYNGDIEMWNAETLRHTITIHTGPRPLGALAFTPDGLILKSVNYGGDAIHVWRGSYVSLTP